MPDNSAYSGQNTPQDSTPINPEQPLPIQPPTDPLYPAEQAVLPTELLEPTTSRIDPPTEQVLAPTDQVVQPSEQYSSVAASTPPTPTASPIAPAPAAATVSQRDGELFDQDLGSQYEQFNQTQSPRQNDFNQRYDSDRPQPEEVVLEWLAPSRPFKKRNRQYYTTIGVIVFLISMILFFAGQFLPIAVVIAVAFMAYVLSAVPPEVITNRITTYGIRTDDSLYYWDELGRFWFDEKFHQRLIHIEASRFPNQITLVITGQDEAEVQDVLSAILLNERPPLTSFDKAAQWLQEKIPLDTEA